MLANGALNAGSSSYDEEDEGGQSQYLIRKKILKNYKVEAIIVLPRDMFYTTDISLTLQVLAMALKKIKIGDLVKIVDEKNNIGIREFYGININKEFMPTAASTDNLDEKKYKIVRKKRFVYSGMQTG